MQDLVRKEVEVNAADIIYRGILVQIGETKVHLQTETGWIVIPVDRIVDIKAISE